MISSVLAVALTLAIGLQAERSEPSKRRASEASLSEPAERSRREAATGSRQEKEPFHARRIGDKPSPPATLAAVAWLEGHWLGDGLGGVSEEVWSPPRGGVMMGMYRSLKQDRPSFYEFLMLVEENGTLVLKLKHFNPDFSGWEEKAAFTSFKLVAVEGRAVHFDGLSFIREPDDTLRIYLLLRDKTGQVREEAFKLRRSTPRQP